MQKSNLTALSAIKILYCTGLQFKMTCFRGIFFVPDYIVYDLLLS